MVSYNGLSLGGPGLSIMDRNGDVTPLQGRYSAYLFAGYIPGEGDFDMSISQTGLVPAGAYALRLDAHSAYGFSVSLGGRTLSMAPLANFPNYTRYEAAIPDFTGQTAELRITSLYPYGSIPPNGLLLDNIVFMTIPESASIPIVGLSFLLFRLWPRRSHSKRAAAKWA